jgi:membrane-bound serine protease (ClpP class)
MDRPRFFSRSVRLAIGGNARPILGPVSVPLSELRVVERTQLALPRRSFHGWLHLLQAIACLGLLASIAAAAFATPAGPSGAESAPIQAVPAGRAAEHVGVIVFRGPIDGLHVASLERRLAQALKDGCDAIVLEIDTPGGDVEATMALCHLLKTRPPTNKVAWIRPRAYSAGTILALACREIVVARGSALGDAAPIAVLPGVGLQPLPVAERAKLEAPILQEVTDSAFRNGHDVRLARAFVDVDASLWLIERDDGKRLFVDEREYEIAFGEQPPQASTRDAQRFVPATPPERDAVAPVDAGEPASEEAAAAIGAFVHNSRIDPAERGRWKLLGQVDTPDELVTLGGDEAYRYGLATAIIDDDQQLLGFFGATKLTRYDENWSEGLVRFLVSMPVRAVLIVVMLLGFFLEWITGGTGIFGTVALVALVILIGAPALAGLAQWWEILLVVVGVVLILLELFVIPGVGIAGIAGAICLLVGLVFSFVGGNVGSAAGSTDLLIAFFAVLGSFAVAFAAGAVLMRRLPSSPYFKRFVNDATSGSDVAPAPIVLGPPLPSEGAVGTAITDLRPSGRAAIGDGVFDVRTGGAWIERGAQLRVVGRDGLGLIVEAC